jgi:hypothetical protein
VISRSGFFCIDFGRIENTHSDFAGSFFVGSAFAADAAIGLSADVTGLAGELADSAAANPAGRRSEEMRQRRSIDGMSLTLRTKVRLPRLP